MGCSVLLRLKAGAPCRPPAVRPRGSRRRSSRFPPGSGRSHESARLPAHRARRKGCPPLRAAWTATSRGLRVPIPAARIRYGRRTGPGHGPKERPASRVWGWRWCWKRTGWDRTGNPTGKARRRQPGPARPSCHGEPGHCTTVPVVGWQGLCRLQRFDSIWIGPVCSRVEGSSAGIRRWWASGAPRGRGICGRAVGWLPGR